MSKRHPFVLLGAIALMVLGAYGDPLQSSWAQGGQATAPGGLDPNDPMTIYKQAGVDPDQENKIRQMAKEFEDLGRVRAQRMLGLLREMRALQMQPDPDRKTVMAKQDEINKLQADMANQRITLLLNIRALLNPEQKQKLVSLLQDRQGPAQGGQGQPQTGGQAQH